MALRLIRTVAVILLAATRAAAADFGGVFFGPIGCQPVESTSSPAGSTFFGPYPGLISFTPFDWDRSCGALQDPFTEASGSFHAQLTLPRVAHSGSLAFRLADNASFGGVPSMGVFSRVEDFITVSGGSGHGVLRITFAYAASASASTGDPHTDLFVYVANAAPSPFARRSSPGSLVVEIPIVFDSTSTARSDVRWELWTIFEPSALVNSRGAAFSGQFNASVSIASTDVFDSTGQRIANARVKSSTGDDYPAAPDQPTRSAIVYVNGINTPEHDAFIDAFTVLAAQHWARYKQHPDADGSSIRYELAYNPTDGLWHDLFEATIQGLGGDVPRFFRILAGSEETPDFMRVALDSLVAELNATEVQIDQVSSEHVNQYRALLSDGRPVTIVSHSQGNFFANGAYDRLSPAEAGCVAIVGVASPAAVVAGGGSYFTLREDGYAQLFIRARSVVGLGTLPPNVSNRAFSTDPSLFPFDVPSDTNLRGHAFAGSYLSPGAVSQKAIIDEVEATRRRLVSNPVCNP